VERGGRYGEEKAGRGGSNEPLKKRRVTKRPKRTRKEIDLGIWVFCSKELAKPNWDSCNGNDVGDE
jgi:hypothetical protein